MIRRRDAAFHRYRFRSEWLLDAPPDAVYAVLEQADAYPRWWPQVRAVVRIDDRTGTARFRSFLPYDLHVTVREMRSDPAGRVLEIAMSGDLEGWARWTVLARGAGNAGAECGVGSRGLERGAGSVARFEQEVVVCGRLMRWLALPGRPLFVANHAWMMRGGRRGLAALLDRRAAGPAGLEGREER